MRSIGTFNYRIQYLRLPISDLDTSSNRPTLVVPPKSCHLHKRSIILKPPSLSESLPLDSFGKDGGTTSSGQFCVCLTPRVRKLYTTYMAMLSG